MKRLFYLCLIVFAFMPTIAQGNLKLRVLEELRAPSPFPCPSAQCPTEQQILSYQYIFVGGFLVDHFRLSFKPMIKVLSQDFGVKDLELVTPSSSISIQKNVEYLSQQILALRKSNPKKKALIVAHSKGGVESLLMALRYPQFIESGMITDVVLLDGALQGSPLADLWVFCKTKNSLSPEAMDLCQSIRDGIGETL